MTELKSNRNSLSMLTLHFTPTGNSPHRVIWGKRKKGVWGKTALTYYGSYPLVSAEKSCHLHSIFCEGTVVCSRLEHIYAFFFFASWTTGACELWSAVESSCTDVPGCSCDCGCSECSVQFMASNCSVLGSSTFFMHAVPFTLLSLKSRNLIVIKEN